MNHPARRTLVVLVALTAALPLRAQSPTGEGGTEQSKSVAQPQGVRVAIVHKVDAKPCHPDGDHCVLAAHWSYVVGETSIPVDPQAQSKLTEALVAAAAKTAGTGGTERPAPKVTFTVKPATSYGMIRDAFAAAASAKLSNLEVVVEKEAGRVERTSPVTLPTDQGLAAVTRTEKPLTILLSFNRDRRTVERIAGDSPIPPGKEGTGKIAAAIQDDVKRARAEKRDPILVIDSGPAVPWEDVAEILAAGREAGVSSIEFKSR